MPSGYYDASRSKHHANWVWHTKSHNCATLSDASQLMQSHDSVGAVVNAFEDDRLVYFCGRADGSYPGRAVRYRRHVTVDKMTNGFLMIDEHVAPPRVYSALQWNIHSWNEIEKCDEDRTFRIEREGCGLTGTFLCHEDSFFVMSEGWDPPPTPTKSTLQWYPQYHLRFSPTAIGSERYLGTLLQPRRVGDPMMDVDRWREEDGREAAALGTSTYTIDLPGDPAGSIARLSVDGESYVIDDVGIHKAESDRR